MRAQCAGPPLSERFLVLLHVVRSGVLIQISEQTGHTKQGPFCDSGEHVCVVLWQEIMLHLVRRRLAAFAAALHAHSAHLAACKSQAVSSSRGHTLVTHS